MAERSISSELIKLDGVTLTIERLDDGHTETGFPKYKPGRVSANVHFTVNDTKLSYELKDFDAAAFVRALET